MDPNFKSYTRCLVGWCKVLILALLLFTFAVGSSQAFTLNVKYVDQNGDLQTVTDFRWLVQEDTTFDLGPDKPGNQLSLEFHSSYAPPVATGDQDSDLTAVTLDSNKRYFVSVLPDAGYSIGGAKIIGGVADVRVTAYPIPTAQISVFVFEDDFPINNAPDIPEERGLEGFKVTVEDAGGRYGISAGFQMMDAFGNPLGTVYGQDGSVVQMGDGVLTTDANGEVLIQNLAPGKYGIIVIPPAGEGWQQTSTIEGKKVIDVWVKANEPPFFVEFGPPGFHAFFGFIQGFNDLASLPGDNRSDINGRVVNLHNSRPPEYTFNNGHPIPDAWVGLNAGPNGTGEGVYAGPCNDDSTFSIIGIPDGTYELVIWDKNKDVVFATKQITLPADAGELGDIGVFNWFGRLEGGVFEDLDGDGFWDDNEQGIGEQAINIRWRDGSIYQSFPTDLAGEAPFDEVFPFFHWLVAEVDFARIKATGATFTVDAGGPVEEGEVLNPQIQTENCTELDDGTFDCRSRTETGEVLTQAFQVFLGQTVRMEFGKAPYDPDTENGGISGMVLYATTRAENDPTFAAAEVWEPGIPRVQVNLYRDDFDNEYGWQIPDGIIDPIGADPLSLPFDTPVLADVDNYPFEWSTGNTDEGKGDEDIDHNGNAVFDMGDAVDVTWTDSWDDNLPVTAGGSNCPPPFVCPPGIDEDTAFDGLRNFNQARPGVFDGGYAFGDLAPGTYIVEAKAPAGYEHVKEEDKNVDFGDEYSGQTIPLNGNPVVPGGAGDNEAPVQDALDNMPILVGDLRNVPDELTLFPGVPAPFATEERPLPDRKQVYLGHGLNSACDFFLFTQVPVAGQIVGVIVDDVANEFDPAAPTFGEKYGPADLPISIRDWKGNLVSYTASDKYGAYNALVPSTFTANLPQPSGMSPNMLTVILNDPTHPDISANPKYSQFSYTFQYMPGTTTYLDTPVVPIAAFAGPGQDQVDVEFPDGTPVIKQVYAGPEVGPYVPSTGSQITIESMVSVFVPDPLAQDGDILRDYGFGDGGTVTIGGVPLTDVTWANDSITGTVAPGTTTGQLVVTRSDNNKSSVLGLTVTVGPLGNGPTGPPRQVIDVSEGQSIQAAIDSANPGDLILVGPGTYKELVIMYKPVQLQGWGAGVTIIDAVQVPHEKILNWREKIAQLWFNADFDLLPAQEIGFAGLEPALAAVEGAGISVYAMNTIPEWGGFEQDVNARIDGLTVQGASTGGGIFVNGYARFLEISNNRVRLNFAAQGGAIAIGHPNLVLETGDGLVHQDSGNDHIRIHHNQIAGNGGLGGAGGGVSLYTGAHNYEVTDNFIAGNFMRDNGGGIGHFGRSDNGTIARNKIVFNQSFNQGLSVSGGGIFIGGAAPLGDATETAGSGSVKIDANLIQGNQAGAGDGGGIRTQRNLVGDIIDVTNNFIVNNMAGMAGGGLSMQDTQTINIYHNTVARNDSTATAGNAFLNDPNKSEPQPAGIVSHNSSPTLDSNIIWENRSFSFSIESQTEFGLTLVEFDDLGPGLACNNCIVTGGTAPAFVDPYFNDFGGETIIINEFTVTPGIALAFDEGGNFIDVRFSPLSIDVGANQGTNTTDYMVTASVGDTGPVNDLTITDVDGDYALGESYIGADLYVNSDNLAPIAANEVFTLVFGPRPIPVPLVVDAPGLLANDYDPEGAQLSIASVIAGPSNGTLTLDPDGSFTYLANRRFQGTDTATYLVSDGSRYATATATFDVRFNIAQINNPPVPTAQDINTQINTPGITRVLHNDPDVGDTHTYEIVRAPQNGTAVVTSSGKVTYTPETNFLGTDWLRVRVTDSFNASGLVRINVSVSLNLPATQDLVVQMPFDDDGEDTDLDGIIDNDNVYLLLSSGDGFSTMADGYEQYIFGYRELSHLLPEVQEGDPAVRTIPMDTLMDQGVLGAEWPAPTIEVREGQKLYLNLVNVGMAMRPDLFDAHTVHWHGFANAAPVFDGVPDSAISVNMMAMLTYFYNVTEPGTYMYHCHVEATEHMQMGMLGNLYVTPKQDFRADEFPKADGSLYKGFAYNDGDGTTGYDVDYPLQIGGFDPAYHDASLTTQPLPFQNMVDKYPMINGRGYPDTLVEGSLPPSAANTYAEQESVAGAPSKRNKLAFNVNLVDTSLANINDVYNGLDLIFTSGPNQGIARRIEDYRILATGNNKGIRIVLDSKLPFRPQVGNTFTIGRASQNVNSRIEATSGQKILLRISNLNITRFHTLASPLPMKVVGKDARILRGPGGEDLYYTTNSVHLGGGESVDVIVDTANVAPGTYIMYTTNLNYLSNNQEDFGGIMTEIVIK